MSDEEPIIKHNKPWKNESFHDLYEDANKKRNKLLQIWEGNIIHKGMQVKVKFLPSREKFVVKTRLHPDFEQEKKKNVKHNKKNKRNNDGGKYDLQRNS